MKNPEHPTRLRAHRRRPGLSLDDPEGFTLVEVLTVLVLVGVMAGIVVPRIDLGGARTNAMALRASSRLMMAQRVAVVRQHDVRVLFDADRRTLIVHHDEDNDRFFDGDEQVVRHDLADGVEFGRGDAKALPYGEGPISFSEDPNTGMPVVAYHRNGSASEEGVAYLVPRGESSPEDVRAVHVRRATGQVGCWTHRTGEWTEGC